MEKNSHKNQFLKERSDKIEEMYRQYSDLSNIIRKNITSYLKELLLATPEHKIPVFYSEECDCLPTITYDGGNHPEYASNAYSEVTGISLREDGSNDNGKILVDCEDEPGVELNRIYSLDELYEILKFAEWYVFDRKEEEEEE